MQAARAPMIAPIDDANQDVAVALLAKGFPGHPASRWAEAIARIRRFGGNAALGLPIGQVMTVEGEPAGVALTIASRREDAGSGPQTHVNFAAWYVETAHRWRAPLMLRAVTRMPCDVLTDLTPSDQVRALLPAFGFRQITRGVAINLAALHRGGGRVLALDDAGAGSIPPGLRALLEAHVPFGNIPALLECRDGTMVALSFRLMRWRGFTMARMIYCGSNRQLFDHLGAVSSFLRGHGAALIKLEASMEMAQPPGWMRESRELKFARGPMPPDVTDYLGSELALLDLDTMGPADDAEE